MSDSCMPADTPDKGRHYDFIASAVDDSFKTATVDRGLALAATPLNGQAWYTNAPSAYLEKLKAANLKAWASQNQVDRLLEKVDLVTFATSLLQAKLKERHGIETTTKTGCDTDIERIWLRLYMPKDQSWYTRDFADRATARTVSLLEAALHNFARHETVAAGSDFISKPDKIGNFDVLPIKQKMSVSQFQALCRELDIGAQYKKHLESHLLPDEPVATAVLKHKVTLSQKDALAVAAHIALLTNDIEYDAYKMLLALADGQTRLTLNGRRLQSCDLSMLGTRLTGILLLIPAVRDSRGINRLIAYLPNDPDHPLKEYPSPQAFSEELARQLRENRVVAATKQSYQQYFSQFVDQKQRGHFFAELEQRLFIVRYHKKADATDSLPAWRKDNVAKPQLQLQHLPLSADYWTHAYQQKLNKILNDARELAVSTADADSKARWAWWDNFKKIVSDIFNAVLLIVTPFVPGLGELMMGYTIYQITTDVIEGLVDLAEGLWTELGEHVIGVVTSLIELVAFAAGAKIGNTFKLKLSPLVEGMKPVQLPNGKPALWHPDLAPYEQKKLNLPALSRPDRLGLHQSGKETLLPLEGKLYSVEKASTHPASRTHRIKHPSRPNAYRPKIEHNNHGAWLHEAENPHDWDEQTLMPRLGHQAERFSPAELEQIRICSGTDTAALRQMHSDNAAPPPLLADTLKHFSAYDDVRLASEHIRKGQPIDAQAVWFEPIPTSLPGWPPERALRVFASDDLRGYSRQYGNHNATPAQTLDISHADLNAGRLPERLAGFLDDADSAAMLGRDVPPARRAQALRERLADAVQARQGEVAERMYQAGERTDKADIRVVQQTFPKLPLTLAEKLLSQASPVELQRIANEDRLPLRLKTQARELDFEASATRAFEGFYHPQRLGPDTERLALNALRFHTDSFADLRIEVREGTYDGALRCSVGTEDAGQVRRLIRNEHGQYEVLDANNRSLRAAGDFYQAILDALPADKRTALGQSGRHGQQLKTWIMEKALTPGERRTLLAEPPVRPVPPLETEVLVRGWPRFFGGSTAEQRIKRLYPKMNDREVATYIRSLKTKGDGNPDQAIKRLENERKALRDTLQQWRDSYPASVDSSGEPIFGASIEFMQDGGRFLEERLLESFERKSAIFGERNEHPEQGYILDLSSELARPNLDRWWSDLRKRPGIKQHLDQITALKLDNARFSAGDSGLLNDFAQLRQLSARQCELTDIPPALGRMRQLQALDLTNNRIRLTAGAREQLGGLIRLQTLTLDGNPLGQAPNVGRMYRLRELNLANSKIQTWPEGLFKVGDVNRQRPRGFALDMRDCPIRTLPEVTPGSDQAFVLSRARFDTALLSDADRIRYGNYRESLGFARQQAFSQAVKDEIAYWQSFPDETTDYTLSAYRKYREESWQDVRAEPGSADFFSIIRKQRESNDYQSDKSRRQLTRRVWELIDAVALDSELREELFKESLDPKSCEDGGAQQFNIMGMKVLVSKAYAESTSARALDNKLVRLARSAARLNLVAEAARIEVQQQRQQNAITPRDPRTPAPDEVEVHLAYQTGLATRLELPWQSEGMLYQPRSGVTQAKINAAYDSIIAREEGDGLVDAMIELHGDPFWKRHLDRTHPTQSSIDEELFTRKREQIEELRLAQSEWANPTPETRMSRLQRQMESLANQLGVPQLQVFSGHPMSDVEYNRLLINASRDRYALARRWTREAMENAGL